MSDTSISLLERLRDPEDRDSWQQLMSLYNPLIHSWLRRYSVTQQDADDLVQEILAVVVRKLPQFRRQEFTGAFRGWLKAITVNCLRDHWRSRRGRPLATGSSDFKLMLDQLADENSGLSRRWDEEHDRHVMQSLLEMIRPQFTPATWQAFARFALDDVPAADVAAELNVSVNTVYIAKSRVLTKLRQVGAGLLD